MFVKLNFATALSILGAMLLASALAIAAQTTKETTRGPATVTTSELSGEVLGVEGNDLAIKLTSGEVRVFHVPPTRRFVVDGKELTVGELQPGTTLTATVKTTTTPVTVRTKTSIKGKVWYVSPPNVILTLSTGENKSYVVKHDDNVGFTMNGQPATVFDLRKGMMVSAERIVEEPDTEIVTDTTVTGHAPAVAAAKETEPAPPVEAVAAKSPAPEPEAAKSPAPEPAEAKPAHVDPVPAPAPATAPASIPAEPTTSSSKGLTPVIWVGLFALAAVIVIAVRAMRSK